MSRRDPDGCVCLHEQRRRRARGGPGIAGLVETVVEPRQGPRSGVGVDRVELPVPARGAFRRRSPRRRSPLALGARSAGTAARWAARVVRGGIRWRAPPSRCTRRARRSRPARAGERRAVAERKCGMPSIEWNDPAGGAWGEKPKRETTPSMSTSSKGLVRWALSDMCVTRPLAPAEVPTANLPESMRGSKALCCTCRWTLASATADATPRP